MYAVFRETTFSSDFEIRESPEFEEFQRAHAERPGYKGTVVADVGGGRYLTVTLWETAEDMNAARESLGPVVGRLLDPLMASPSRLLGTGEVMIDDLT